MLHALYDPGITTGLESAIGVNPFKNIGQKKKLHEQKDSRKTMFFHIFPSLFALNSLEPNDH